MHLGDDEREVIAALLEGLAARLAGDPDDPDLARLAPSAYPDDPDQDAAYRLLAGEELRSSRQQAVQTVLDTVRATTITEAQAWSWLQALNAVRLVVGTQLGIDQDDDGPGLRGPVQPGDEPLWAIYDFSTLVQQAVVEALGS